MIILSNIIFIAAIIFTVLLFRGAHNASQGKNPDEDIDNIIETIKAAKINLQEVKEVLSWERITK
jgi:hypothetical protein